MSEVFGSFVESDLRMLVGVVEFPLTAISACAEYGLCSKPTSYITFRVSEKVSSENSWLTSIFIGDGSVVEYDVLHGKKIVPKYRAILDFCYNNTDDSALQEVFDGLLDEGELDKFWEYALNNGMSDDVKKYLEYFYLGGEYADCPEGFN